MFKFFLINYHPECHETIPNKCVGNVKTGANENTIKRSKQTNKESVS